MRQRNRECSLLCGPSVVARALLLAALLSPVVAGAVLAQTGTSALPDLRGVWLGTHASPTDSGRIGGELRIEVTRQDGALLWGDNLWHEVDPATGKPRAEWRRDPMIGSLDASGNGGSFVKDAVQLSFRLLAPDAMELELASYQPMGGVPPIAFYSVLKRGSAGTLPQAKQPDLAGSWRGPCLLAGATESRPGSVQLDLVRQDGELLWMDDVWSPAGPVTAATDPKTVLRERLRGSLNPSGTGGVLVKEGARVAFRLLAADLMEVELVRMVGRPDPPTAFYAVVRRGGEGELPAVGKVPDLVGTWAGSARYALAKEGAEGTSNLVVTRQQGAVLWVDDVWTSVDRDGEAPTQHRETMTGSLAPDLKHGVLAKADAYFSFRVLDADHLEVGLTRIGRGERVFFAVYTRKR